MINTQHTQKKGFALLYTVVIVSLILSITAGISNIVFKQSLLSNLATDSQIAFYQADNAAECAMYLLNNTNANFDPTGPVTPFFCSTTQSYELDAANSSIPGLTIYSPAATTLSSSSPCSSITIDQTDPSKTVIEAHGFNVCNSANPRHIERVLQVTY